MLMKFGVMIVNVFWVK